jgi:hypothetical protein
MEIFEKNEVTGYVLFRLVTYNNDYISQILNQLGLIFFSLFQVWKKLKSKLF